MIKSIAPVDTIHPYTTHALVADAKRESVIFIPANAANLYSYNVVQNTTEVIPFTVVTSVVIRVQITPSGVIYILTKPAQSDNTVTFWSYNTDTREIIECYKIVDTSFANSGAFESYSVGNNTVVFRKVKVSKVITNGSVVYMGTKNTTAMSCFSTQVRDSNVLLYFNSTSIIVFANGYFRDLHTQPKIYFKENCKIFYGRYYVYRIPKTGDVELILLGYGGGEFEAIAGNYYELSEPYTI